MSGAGDVSELPTPRGNPFLQNPVIRVMCEEADWVTLKVLREMNSDWNNLDLKELGRRGSMGQIWGNDFRLGRRHPMEQVKAKFVGFMQDTQNNPQIFKSFHFNFPESFVFIDPSFFSTYSPTFIHLNICKNFQQLPMDELHHILHLMSPHLEEFKILITGSWNPASSPEISSQWTIQAPGSKDLDLVFPKLTKLCCDNCVDGDRMIRYFFKTELMNPTPKLHILELDSNRLTLNMLATDLQSPNGQIRWSRLTHLDFHGIFNEEDCIKYLHYYVSTIKAQSQTNQALIRSNSKGPTVQRKKILDIFPIGSYFRVTEVLLSMAQAGMKLIYLSLFFRLEFTLTYWPDICRNISNFFKSQSKSLESLKLWCCNGRFGPRIPEIISIRIQLPVFEVLHSLLLDIELENCMKPITTPLFEMESLPLNFPKLQNLGVNTIEMLETLYPKDVNAERIHLQKLYIGYYKRDFPNKYKVWKDWLESKFASVKDLRCCSQMLWCCGSKLPWANSLKVLKITAVKQPLHVSYLTALEEMYVNEEHWEYLEADVKNYLSCFDEVRKLKLSKITIAFSQVIPDNAAMIKSYFPFPVEFIVGSTYLNIV